jgi:hypothetical protein
MYFGSFPPVHYGVAAQEMPFVALVSRPPPGLYAVSAFWMGRVEAVINAAAPGRSSWLTDTAPTAIVGHAYYIYDIK